MIPWIQVYSNLPQHPKTTKLADELGLSSAALNPNVLAVGLLVSLWSWAAQAAHDGDLSGCSNRAIAEACLWKKKPDTLVKALQSAGFLDEDMKLHDWEEYACLLMEQEENRRAKTRDRVKRYREKKAADGNAACNAPCNVTETPCNAPTLPYPTIPDQNSSFSGGGGARAQARAEIAQFCDGRDLEPGDYFGATEEIRGYVAALADALFDRFATRKPTETDVAQVFNATFCSNNTNGTWEGWLSKDRKELLMYAFETACAAGKGGDWRYINGILGNLGQRGIRTLREAEEYDIDRDADRGRTT